MLSKHHKYPSTPHLPFSPEKHKDDRDHKDPLFFIGKEVVVTEKLDGGNTCIHAGLVYARTVGLPTNHGSFTYIKNAYAHLTLGDSYNIYYGENLQGIHSIDYVEVEDYFYLFAARHLFDDVFFSWDKVNELAKDKFKVVPVLFRGEFSNYTKMEKWMEEEIKKPSTMNPSAPKEGFVIRIADEFHAKDFSMNVAKYVRRGHVQSGEHWKRNWKTQKLIKK